MQLLLIFEVVGFMPRESLGPMRGPRDSLGLNLIDINLSNLISPLASTSRDSLGFEVIVVELG